MQHLDCSPTTPASLTLSGCQYLGHGGLITGNIAISDGQIKHIDAVTDHNGRENLNLDGCYVFPGIVDLHGDAFERAITPRSGVSFPISQGIAENDLALISSGITTFFYAITDGFEPGLRSRDTVREMLHCIEDLQPRLLANSFLHIRHETANLEKPEELIDWMEHQRVHLLSLNDHLPHFDNEEKLLRFRRGLNRRVAMSDEQVDVFLKQLATAREPGEILVEQLCSVAGEQGIALAAHDDCTVADVERSHTRRVAINEFPMSLDAAHRARELGQTVVLGAPNLIRGSSHVGGLSVRDAVSAGVCDALCSDYSYPSLLRAPFLLAELGILPLHEAWRLVSLHPAQAAGLPQKGHLNPGADADLLIFDALDGSNHSLRGVVVGGHIVHWRGPFPR